MEERINKERQKILSILSAFDIDESRLELLSHVIENTAWMAVKLEDARETIKTSQIAISYDNGGGQKGIRENPLFKGYNSLWKSYTAGMDKILSLIPKEVAEEEKPKDTPKSVLEIVRSKHNSA